MGTTLGVVALSLLPAGAAAPAAAGPAAAAALPGRARPRGCAGWPWPGCSPWPASSWSPWWRSGWPTTGAARRHPGRLRRRPDAVPRALGRAGRAAGHLGLPGADRAGRASATTTGYRRALAPVAVLVVGAVRGGRGRAGRGVRARWPGSSCAPRPTRDRRRPCGDTIVAFAPGLVGYGLVARADPGALRPRALAGPDGLRGRRLAGRRRRRPRAGRGCCRPRTGPLALGAGHTARRHRGRPGPAGRGRPGRPAAARWPGCPASGRRRCWPRCSAARPGWAVARALGADPVPGDGVLAAVGVGVLAGAVVLVVAAAVMMGAARGRCWPPRARAPRAGAGRTAARRCTGGEPR